MVDQTDWETATISEFDTIHFHGDLIFRCGNASYDYRNVPLLGFAHELTEAFLYCIQQGSAKVYFALLEGNDWLNLSLCQGREISIKASYCSDSCLVSVVAFRTALHRANMQLIADIEERFPFLKGHFLFQQIVAVLRSV